MTLLGAAGARAGRSPFLNRPSLEQLCCECYSVAKKESHRLLPQTLG